MVDEVMKKATATVLAVALLFAALVPVPSGLGALDRVRYQKAYAGPEAAVLGSTPAVMLTLMGMAGVYVACHTDGEWLENSAAVASDFAAFVNANGYVNEYNCDLSQYVDSSGNVDIQAAYDGGFYDMLQAYLNSEQAAQMFSSGTNSINGQNSHYFTYNGSNFTMAESAPYANMMVDKTQEELASDRVMYAYSTSVDGSGRTIVKYFYHTAPIQIPAINPVSAGGYVFGVSYTKIWTLTLDNGTVYSRSSSAGNVTRIYSDDAVTSSERPVLLASASLTLNGVAVEALNVSKPGVFNPTSVSERIAEIANGAYSKVATFTPTAAQIEAGYDYQTIVQNELAGIHTGIEGLDTVLNAILAVLQTIAGITTAPFSWLQAWWNTLTGWWGELLSWIRATPLGQFCADVTAWLGETPFGHIAATVIDGVQAIPGAVVGAGQAVLEGVQAIPGAISGTLEGILEGVQAIPGAVVGAISAVGTAVDAISGAIATVMEFINGGFTFDALPVVAPPNWMEELEVDLSDKVPFCYVIRSYHALGDMFGNFSNNRSFYLEMEIPEAGVVTMDGEQVLGLSFGLLDIATTIRILFTSLLCFGLLYRAYKIIERTANSL